MQRINNNFKIGTIISFLKTIKKEPEICLQGINYITGLHLGTLIILRDTLLKKGYIDKHEANKRRTNLLITLKGRKLLNELNDIRKR